MFPDGERKEAARDARGKGHDGRFRNLGGDETMAHVAGGGGREQWSEELVGLKSHGQGKWVDKYRKTYNQVV